MRQDREPIDPDLDFWSDESDDDEPPERLGPAPAPPSYPGAAMDPAAPAPQRMLDLGEPPSDAAALQKWMYQLLAAQAYETVVDPTLSQTARRKELRIILASASKHFPEAAKYDLSQQINADREELDAKKRNRAAAKLERRPKSAGAKVIPIRRDG